MSINFDGKIVKKFKEFNYSNEEIELIIKHIEENCKIIGINKTKWFNDHKDVPFLKDILDEFLDKVK